MNNFTSSLKEKYNNNKKQLNFCIITTLVFGLIAHSYMFFQDSFSHDSLNEFNADVFGNEWKVQLGRFIVPLYRMVTRGNLTLPWLVGIISLLWIALSVFLVVKSFKIENKIEVALISGIFATNIAVISTTATYINDLDSNMCALFCSVVAFFVWEKYKYGFLLAIPFITVSLGLYQAYVSVTIVLIIIYLILDLLKGSAFGKVFLNGVKSVITLAVGGILYYAVYKAIFAFTGISQAEGKYNTMDQLGSGSFSEFISTLIYVVKATVYGFFFPKNAVSGTVVMVLIALSFLITAVFVLSKLLQRKIGILEKILVLALIALLPVGMGFSSILSGDLGHDLMRFSDWLIFLFVLLITYDFSKEWQINGKTLKKLLACVGKSVGIITVAAILWGNVVSANEIYLKKELEQDSNLAFFTRVVDRMDCFEGYNRKTNKVVFVGRPDYYDENKVGFKNGYEITGATGNYVLGAAAPSWYDRYFEYKLHYDILTVDNSELDEYQKSDLVKSMPVFPEEGCMQIVDDVLIVKLGEIK